MQHPFPEHRLLLAKPFMSNTSHGFYPAGQVYLALLLPQSTAQHLRIIIKRLLFFWLCSATLSLSAQINTDSLYQVWEIEAVADTVRLQAIHAASTILAKQNPDTAIR